MQPGGSQCGNTATAAGTRHTLWLGLPEGRALSEGLALPDGETLPLALRLGLRLAPVTGR